MFKTPILFLIFNRLDTTRLVFEQIKKVRPAYLFIAADGARNSKDGEKEKCEEVRRWVLGQIDWDCDVKTLFRDQNCGCKYAVSGAISWFFENVEEGIILEDDCLPNESFFFFCQQLLDKYRDVEKVMHISGNNFQNGIKRGDADYYFSVYNHIWGWATWKRAWRKYDVEMKEFDRKEFAVKLRRIMPNAGFRKYWTDVFIQTRLNLIDTWDYQWTFCIWNSNGLCILPQNNLVSNIGFNANATHTKTDSPLSCMTTKELVVTKHPKRIKVNKKADDYTSKSVFSIPLKPNSAFILYKQKLMFYINHLRK